MSVSRLAHIPGIGVDEIGDAADAARNPDLLRWRTSTPTFRRPRWPGRPPTPRWTTTRPTATYEPVEHLGDLRARFDAALA